MNLNDINISNESNVLLIQGPMGTFFKSLGKSFEDRGANVFHIGLNIGDKLFSAKHNYVPYHGTKDDWSVFIDAFYKTNNIDKVFVFGDCRFYQSIALQKAEDLGLESYVFEEGYVRPYFVTLERYGVNNYSKLPRNRAFYESLKPCELINSEPVCPNNKYYKQALSAMAYYFAGNHLNYSYPHYEHHRNFSWTKEAFFGVRSWVRKYKHKINEKGLIEELIIPQSKNYFLVPLQTHNDFQVVTHSKFCSIKNFINEVMYSYAQSQCDELLIIKHHPVDRGRKDYFSFIMNKAELYGITDKVKVVYDLHLPTCLKNAKGVVTINSTVGLSALYHNAPVKVLGEAIYDIDGITDQNDLTGFWDSPVGPDKTVFNNFYHYLITKTQLNLSFYGDMELLSAPFPSRYSDAVEQENASPSALPI